MNVTLTSTTKLTEFEVNGATVPARIWEGFTEGGVPVHAYITRIAVDEKYNSEQFDRELQQHEPPSAAVAAIPLRMIL